MHQQPVRSKAARPAVASSRNLKAAAPRAARLIETLESRRLMTSVLQPAGVETTSESAGAGIDVPLVGPFAMPAEADATPAAPQQTTRAKAAAKPAKPTVTLAVSANSTAAPATVTLTADASDADGSVARVDFYRGSKRLTSDVEAPFTLSLDGVGKGTHSYSVRAIDDAGLVTRSKAVNLKIEASPAPAATPTPAPAAADLAPVPTLTAQQTAAASPPPAPATVAHEAEGDAPSVSLVNPASGKYAGPGFWALRADASDADGSVVRVDFVANGSVIASTTAAPFIAAWTDVVPGTYEVTAVAYDDAGRSSTSEAAKVTVEQPKSGRTYHVSPAGRADGSGSAQSPVDSIDKAMSMAGPGDTVLVAPGTYEEEIKLSEGGTRQKPIVLKAQEPGTVIVDGGGTRSTLLAPQSTSAAQHVWVSGLTFRNADNGPGGYQAAVRTGDGWRVEDCLIEKVNGNGLGIFGDHVLVRRVVAQDNGVSGISGSGIGDSLLLDSVTRRNNTSVHTSEGGGGKITRSDGLLVDGLEADANTGPGFWLDIDNINCVVRNSTFHDNVTLKKADGTDRITGRGLFLEISGVDADDDGSVADAGPLLVENNLAHDNGSSGITVYATHHAHLRGNTIVDDVIEVKDRRPTPYKVQDLTIENNFFKDAQIKADGASAANFEARGYVIDGNTYDNADGKAAIIWSGRKFSSPASAFDALGFEKTGRAGRVDPAARAAAR